MILLARPLPASCSTPRTSQPARLTFTRVFKGSTPEYLAISLDSNGEGAYEGHSLAGPRDPRPIKLSPATTERLFELADQLGDFRSLELESHKRVANLGLKTFTYESADGKNEVQFNFTLNKQAQELTALFEKIAAVEEHIQTLEFAIRYDPLGLPAELARIQIDLENQALADPELMVPSLVEIANNPRFLHLAQVRAQNILRTVNPDK